MINKVQEIFKTLLVALQRLLTSTAVHQKVSFLPQRILQTMSGYNKKNCGPLLSFRARRHTHEQITLTNNMLAKLVKKLFDQPVSLDQGLLKDCARAWYKLLPFLMFNHKVIVLKHHTSPKALHGARIREGGLISGG